MKTITTLFALLAALFITGCNTVKGVGQDVQKAGSVIENAGKK